MATAARPGPAVLVIFGAAGDRTWRKLIPAIYNLFLEKWLPDKFAVIGTDRQELETLAWAKRLRQGVDQFSRSGKAKDEDWHAFAALLSYQRADITASVAFADLALQLDTLDREWGARATRVYYLAIPPDIVGQIAGQLSKAKLMRNKVRERIVVEKPFGHDLQSARLLNSVLLGEFDESQIYRIDHFLGKETVQNISAFRFANVLWEAIWDRRYIDNVQITVAEQLGVEHRGTYYEHAGALRDMIQNHLLQILCLIAMEPPISFSVDEVRGKKVEVLRAIRPIARDQVHSVAARGQYDEGWLQGKHVPAYRSEPDVAHDSMVETFAALKLFVDNWRWQGVPFYLLTGKRLPARVSEVTVEFRPVPHLAFPSAAELDWQPDRMIVRIEPDEGIVCAFQAKRPGRSFSLRQVHMHFSYSETFKATPPEAYETLLLDVMEGDATLFMRADEMEAAWAVVTPVLERWASDPDPDLPNYTAGSWGPESAHALLARDGRTWLMQGGLETEKRY